MNSILFTCEKCGHPNPSTVDPFLAWKHKVDHLQAEIQRLELKLKTLENALKEYDCSKEKSYPIDPSMA